MKQKLILLCLIFGVIPALISAQAPSASDILTASIEYHDPKGVWEKSPHHITLKESRPGGGDRSSQIMLDIAGEHVRIERQSDEHLLVQELIGDQITHTLDGRTDFDTAEIRKHRISDERAVTMKNYYLYLYGLPMKLKDPGTQISDQVMDESFNNIPAWKLKVTYEASVGDDIWYFYFAKDDQRLVGYRFYHDESANDGEYITLEGEAKVGKLLLPKKRSWYMNKDDRFLGSDMIVHNE